MKFLNNVWYQRADISRNVIMSGRSGIFHFTFPEYVESEMFGQQLQAASPNIVADG